ncbi:MAG TPA: LuxR C-terminal-related transcriptional regulator [Ktedonobacterales bacterium]
MDAQQRDFARIARDIQRLCYAGLDGESLRSAAVERLGQGLEFDAYCCFTADPISQFFTHTIFGGERTLSELDHFIQQVCFEDDINEYTWIVRSRRPVALLSDGVGGHLDRSLCYREILRPRGHAHQARCVFMTRQELWGGLELTRDRKRADFDADEVALLTRITPHLGVGLKSAALRGLTDVGALPSTELPGDMPGMLTLDQRQRIVSCTSAAERWLRELGWPASDRDDATRLPLSVRVLLRALGQSLAPSSEADTLRIPRISVQTSSGRWLSLVADAALAQGDTPPLTMVLIEPLGPHEATWLRRTAYNLTPREQEVVELVAHGLATREIAKALYVTEYTVQEHLSHIFDKVGVRGRRSLLKRLFFDSISDGSQAPQ